MVSYYLRFLEAAFRVAVTASSGSRDISIGLNLDSNRALVGFVRAAFLSTGLCCSCRQFKVI